MSSVDPREVRRRQAEARVGSPGAAVGIAVGLGLITAGAAFVARAMFGFAEFDLMDEVNEPPLAIFGMIVGLPTIILGFLIHAGASRRFTGRVLSAPGVGPGSILFVGLAVGAWWGIDSMTTVGELWLVPAALTGLAAALLISGAIVRARRRSRQDGLRQLVATGRIVPAVVVEIPEIDASSGGLVGEITVTFTDAAGVDRWVTKLGQWKRAELPVTGDPAMVVFDPARPSDTARIWIGPAGSSTAADFTRWHQG